MSRIFTWFGGLALIAGCSAQPTAAVVLTPEPTPEPSLSPASHGEGAAQPLEAGCPIVFPETWVGHEDVDRGAALVFTTSDDIRGLRETVSKLPLPSALQRVERRLDNIQAGVRIVFEAREERGVELLRRAVEDEALAIARACDMPFALRPSSRDETPAAPIAASAAKPAPAPKPAAQSTVKMPASSPKVKPSPAPTVAPAPSAAPSTRTRPSGKDEPPSSLKPRPAPRRPGL